MKLRDFRRAGHAPTLFAAFLYFDVSFMVWVLIGSLANSIVPELGLSDAQKGLMVAVPLLGGAMLRLVLGVLTDLMGARRTGILGLVLTTIPLLMGWLWADSFSKVLLVGLLLGIAGASFAVACGWPMSMPGADTEMTEVSIPAMSMNSSDCCAVHGSTWPAEPGDAARSTPTASRPASRAAATRVPMPHPTSSKRACEGRPSRSGGTIPAQSRAKLRA